MAECDTCGTCGTGIGGIRPPLPGDPSNDGILTATPAFGGIDINIKYPTHNPFAIAHTILWRGTSDNFALARRHVDPMAGSYFYDRVEPNIRYYYWIQFVSVNGTVGDPIGPASAVARPLIEDLIEELSQKIDEGLLSQTLRSKIDEISVLNANLLDEIKARQNENIVLSQAIQDAQNGVAEALTFIIEEINDRTSSEEAIIEKIDGIASSVEDAYGAVIQNMRVDLDTATQKLAALYTIHTEVNGVVGGFGINNNGEIVEAGFNVDRFWVGRSSNKKVYPFIVEGDEVFIDQGVINKLTFSKLRDEGGNVVVQNGKLQANYFQLGQGQVKSAHIAALQVERGHIRNLAVDTLQINGNAVTVMSIGQGGAMDVPASTEVLAVSASVNMGTGIGPMTGGVIIQAAWTQTSFNDVHIYSRIVRARDGVTLSVGSLSVLKGAFSGVLAAFDPAPVEGINTYYLYLANPPSGVGGSNEDSTIVNSYMTVLAGKR